MDTMDLKQIFIEKLEPDADEGRRQVQEQLQAQMSKSKSGQQTDWKRLMNLLMQLRKVCDQYVPLLIYRFFSLIGLYRSPYLLPDAEPSPYEIGEHLVASSSKIIVIDKVCA